MDSHCLPDVLPDLIQVPALELCPQALLVCLPGLAAANTTLTYSLCLAHRGESMQQGKCRRSQAARRIVNLTVQNARADIVLARAHPQGAIVAALLLFLSAIWSAGYIPCMDTHVQTIPT